LTQILTQIDFADLRNHPLKPNAVIPVSFCVNILTQPVEEFSRRIFLAIVLVLGGRDKIGFKYCVGACFLGLLDVPFGFLNFYLMIFSTYRDKFSANIMPRPAGLDVSTIDRSVNRVFIADPGNSFEAIKDHPANCRHHIRLKTTL
jgi:hypothetical protein